MNNNIKHLSNGDFKVIYETFKDVPGYEGYYQISNLGRVKSLSRKHSRTERILKNNITRGYFFVILMKHHVYKMFPIHKLVAMSFLNHKPNGFEIIVDHINNITTDNRLENLRLITQRENVSNKNIVKSSRYVGVSWNKRSEKYESRIRIDGKLKFLGLFSDELKAADAYQDELLTLNKINEVLYPKVQNHFSNSGYDPTIISKLQIDRNCHNERSCTFRYSD